MAAAARPRAGARRVASPSGRAVAVAHEEVDHVEHRPVERGVLHLAQAFPVRTPVRFAICPSWIATVIQGK